MIDKFKLRLPLQSRKKIGDPLEKNNTTSNIYADLGIIAPFTILSGGQFNSFIGELSENKHRILNQTEQEAFKQLWYAAGVDLGGTGNNIWNLKKGSYDIYNNNGVIIRYEKKNAEVKDKYSSDNARANFVYLSKDGSFVIIQNDRNQKVFLVYVSEDTTDRLLKVLCDAEAEALNIEKDNIISNTRVGIPNEISIQSISTETDRNLDTKFGINHTQSANLSLSNPRRKSR